MTFLFRLLAYLRYLLRSGGAHGLHSPFVFQLYNEVIRPKSPLSKEFLQIRRQFLSNKEILTFTDPKSGLTQAKTVATLTKKTASSHRFSTFLVSLCDWLEIHHLVETGTGIGLNATYLAYGNTIRRIITTEGSSVLAQWASGYFESQQLGKIYLIPGRVREYFEPVVRTQSPELVFLDADHSMDATLFCLNALQPVIHQVKCIVIHDIHWSQEMSETWKQIVNDQRYPLTIDLFQAGLVFPNVEMEKQHFTLRFPLI